MARLVLLGLSCVGSAYGAPRLLQEGPVTPNTGPGVWGTPGGPSFDCAMRKLAYTFGKQLRPDQGAFESLHEALDLNGFAGTCKSEATAPTPEQIASAKIFAAPENTTVPTFGALFVAPDGDDTADGSISSPLQSIQLACDRVAEDATLQTVVLRGGTHYIQDTLYLTAKHSGLTIQSHEGEEAVVSGGTLLKTTWKKSTEGKGNVYVANIKGQVDSVPSLQMNGKHATRARYPNLPGGLEASCGYGCMIPSGDGQWTPPNFDKFGPVTYYTDNQTKTTRDDTPSNWFQHYSVGINGLCSVYDPPVSYWCSEHTAGGGAFAFRTPNGVTPKKGALPHSPYKDVSEAQLFVWRPARWANWMFEVGDYDAATNNFTFGKGGFQGARGSNGGGDWFVENVMEELDNPGEFFFDSKTSNLYLVHNGTGAPAATDAFVVPQKQVLVNMSGSQFAPVTNVKLVGVTYTAAAPTYMEPHGVPSAGDWALDRYGAIFLQGTEGAMVSGCTLTRLGGNAIMVSGYNRNATLKHNEISFVGGNAFAAWGFTNETATDPGRPGVEITNHPMAGVDGTDGNHPRYTTVVNNIAREVGLYEKQSSFFVEAKTAQSIILGNVFFNGPRAGINANDGFGGGDEIGHNLVFSSCRESGDHGPFNSWDRQPYLTTVRTGEPSMIMQWREIHHNFFIDNYSPQENVDNDDGSCFYHTHDNFLVYGGQGMKNDFGGHDNHHYSNIYAYAGQALGVTNTLEGHVDLFQNNTVVLTGNNVGGPQCKAPATIMGMNKYYTKGGTIKECGTQGIDKTIDPGSTVADLPTDATIIGWATAKLSIKGHTL